ncbi:MAG TPA: AI-2E family transporter, partial [Spirochaetota bacterium]|nr:AI-2E family transporter [Spirochaetota bacterium]
MEIKKILKNILFLLSFFVVLAALYLTHIMSDFLLPIIFGFFVAFMFQPILRKFEQTKIPRWLSTIIVIVIALVLLSFFVFIITISIQKFANDLPLYMKDLQKKLLLFIDKLFTLDIIKNYVDKTRLNILITDLITRINFGAYMSSTMAKT